MLTNLMSFDFNDGGDASNQGALLCRLLHVPKAFTGQVMRAAASAHGLITLDNCRQLLCSAFQKLLEREALLQHIHIKQGLGAALCPPSALICAVVLSLLQARPHTQTSLIWAAYLRLWR